MNPKKMLHTTFWAMLFVQTIGSIDLPGKGPRKLPAPRVYVASFVLWSILSLVAEAGQAQARAAARLSVLVLLTGAIIGPFGKTFLSFLEGTASSFGPQPPAGASAPAQPSQEVQV